MGQIDGRRAVERLFQIDDEGTTVVANHVIAGMGVRGDQGDRLRLAEAFPDEQAGPLHLFLDHAPCVPVFAALFQENGLFLDKIQGARHRVGMVGQRRAVLGVRDGQVMDRGQALRQGRQVGGQSCRAALDIIDDHGAHGQGFARWTRAMGARRMAARGAACETGKLVVQVLARGQGELALARHPQQRAGIADNHMVMRQSFLLHRFQRIARNHLEAGARDQRGMQVVEVFRGHRSSHWRRVANR
jgi:hypothetical protein